MSTLPSQIAVDRPRGRMHSAARAAFRTHHPPLGDFASVAVVIGVK
jgi:hypothetical protein